MSSIKRYAPEIGPGFTALAPDTPSTNASPFTNAVISLTAAQIQGMFAAPLTIVPAPATGKAIVVDEIIVELVLTSTAFASGGVVHFYYHGQTTEIMSATIAAATVNGSAGTYIFQLTPVATAGGSVVQSAAGVDITNASGAFTTGTGTAKLFVRYRTVTL